VLRTALPVLGFQPKVVMLMFSLRRATAAASTIVVLIGLVAVPQAANEAKKRAGSYQASNGDKIYDLSVPWPFREGTMPGDTDGDGVADEKDRCPSTPRGAIVDQFGCPTDSDGDGIADGVDRCPNTASGARVDHQGCPADDDRDGVADGVDQCADTPNGAIVDARGCPKDSDNDGVVDGIDKCTDTPREFVVDHDGCPIPIGEVGQQFLDSKSVAYNIAFESGKSNILPQSEQYLDRVGEVLSDWTDAKVEIAGHTDSQGSEAFNKTLSKRRAEAVKKYLVDMFPRINADNLSTAGRGESDPIATNDTPEGRSENRRVEFTLMNAKELGKEVDTRRYKRRGE
jgi:OmpA-OmpF porin, OOP family